MESGLLKKNSTTRRSGGFNASYKRLLAETLPVVIETEAENDRALEVIDRLMSKSEEDLSAAERKLLLLQVRLVEDYENTSYPMGSTAGPVDTLRALMEEHGLKQKDLLDVFGSQGVLSEILNGKRGISKSHARKLADRFGLPVGLFI
jgi:HTH-type transcriptional regulator/antitoxin HigA